MNKQLSAVILLLGIIAAIVLGVRFIKAKHRGQVEAEQKQAFQEALAAEEVWCEACGNKSKLDVSFEHKREFQVCPNCGEKRARPIVYFRCNNPACNQQLIQFVNHVFEGSQFNQSPAGAPVCPSCRQAQSVDPQELHIRRAKEIAKETGQPFPPE